MIELTPSSCPVCGPGVAQVAIARGVDFEYATVPDEFTVVECAQCGTWRLDPRPADSALARLYPESYEPYHFDRLPTLVRRGRALVQRQKAKLLARLLGPGTCLVDVGCGGGALLRSLRPRVAEGVTLKGWDFPGPHLDALERAGFEVLRGPVRAGLVPAASVDVFVLNQVLEHLPDPADVLQQLATMLTPGGAVLIETPDTRGLDAQLFRRRYWGGFHFPRHLYLFNESALRTLLGRAGLACEETTRLPSPAFWVQSVHHAASEHQRLRALAPLFTLRNPVAVALATAVDVLRAPFGPTSNLRVVARKAGVPR